MMQETFPFYIQPWYRKSPFFEATKRAGCKSWGLYNHMLLPTLYDDPIAEYWALANDVTIWDVAVERCVEITGPDAFELTNLITCRDLTSCAVMQCKYVVLTASDGGIVYGRFIGMNATSIFLSAFISDVHSVSPAKYTRLPPRVTM